jgi:hypothetical protein
VFMTFKKFVQNARFLVNTRATILRVWNKSKNKKINFPHVWEQYLA